MHECEGNWEPRFLSYELAGVMPEVGEAESDTLYSLLTLLSHHFGRVTVRSALNDGLREELLEVVRGSMQRILNVVSGPVVSEMLRSSRESTASMFEALAAGALVADRASSSNGTRGVAEGFAVIAALEGRPEVFRKLGSTDGEEG